MKKIPFSNLRITSGFAWFVLVLIIFITQTGCPGDAYKNVSPEKKAGYVKWVDFDITFKRNTTPAMRDSAIQAIENILMDSAAILRNANHPQFYPVFLQSNTGSLTGAPQGFIAVAIAATAPIKDTTCTCARNCGICGLIRNAGINPTGPDPLSHIETITDGQHEFEFEK